MTQFFARADVVACSLNGGAALLDLDSSKYFALNATGALAWESLQAGATLDQLVDIIVARFEVARDRCAADVETLISQLVDENLVRVEEVAGA